MGSKHNYIQSVIPLGKRASLEEFKVKLIKIDRNFNEIFRKDLTDDNIKSHKKPGFHPLFRRYNFQNTTGGQIYPTQPF